MRVPAAASRSQPSRVHVASATRRPADACDLPLAVDKLGIPKRIIHVWGSLGDHTSPRAPAALPLSCRASLVNARLLHPDYEHVFFDDDKIEEFLERDGAEYRDYYYALPPTIQRFDFLRYLAIDALGGFYLDLDVYLARPLDPLRDHSCVFPFEELTISEYLRRQHDWDWEIGNYAFGAEPGHPFIRAVIMNCIRGLTDSQWSARTTANIPKPFRTQFIAPHATGPALVTRTLAEEPQLQPLVTVLFPDDVCDDATWHR